MTTISDLRLRVEKASEPDRRLDALVFRTLGCPLPTTFVGVKMKLQWDETGHATMPVGDMQIRYEPPIYTASLDAVVALIERVMPGAKWVAAHSGESEVWDDPAGVVSFGGGATPPLALLAAFLAALEAKESSNARD